jgi:hypothetical protein
MTEERRMARTSRESGARDKERIDTSDEHNRWAEKLGVTGKQLEAAIKAVGTKTADVERYLRERAEVRRSTGGRAR